MPVQQFRGQQPPQFPGRPGLGSVIITLVQRCGDGERAVGQQLRGHQVSGRADDRSHVAAGEGPVQQAGDEIVVAGQLFARGGRQCPRQQVGDVVIGERAGRSLRKM